MKKTGITLIVLMTMTLLIAPFQSAMASSTISVKLSNYIGNKTSMDISTTGEYKLSGSNVAVTKRYDGKNRYEVANSIASAGWKNPSTVVIVSRDAFDHAISVSPLAYKLGAPILYTNIEKLTKTTENQLKKMNPDNILIVGNTKSISTAAEKSIKKYGKVRRISGKDKFEISQKIAKEMGNYKQAIVVGGNSFMNGIAIASYASRKGYPILLTKKDSIPSYKMPSKVIIIGSTKSTGQKVENQIKKTSQVTRISGANRYELSVNIIKKLNINADKVYLAKASSYIYAMPLSQLAAKSNSTVVYVKPDSVTASLKALLKEKGTYAYHLAGSTSAITDSLKNSLAKQVYLKKNQNYQLNISNGKISLKGIKTYNTLRVVPEKYSTKNVLQIAGKPYLGNINFAIESGYIRPTNENIPFEDYLKGVVPNEMPASWHVEALKAQAVAARTYSVKSIGKVVPDTTAFQVYGGYNWYTNSTKAVDATKGKVLKYNNQLISATYYSSNGGYTEASEEVWGNALPYLVAKQDTKDPVNAWTLKLSKKQLGTTLTASTAASEWSKAKEANAADLAGLKSWLLKNKETAASDMRIASISSLTFSGKTKGQRAKTVSIKLNYHLKNKTGTYTVNKSTTASMKMTEFRTVMGATKVKSTFASVKNNTNDFTISGKGYGHGIGMSQYGAKARAESGNSYSSILSFYYPGTKLTNY
ncbi:SpoIID/LytB domain-containing protein [Bacillus altitudinis]|uniref:SpoIID/LytB domain-containing protein n=1 Tax=Bacillus altitudinis TaxID=293387 RepID=UPI0019339BF4|nr:SpoIID/LytB domain-containing protein [Bacillus altitudinis]MEE3604176.1 SpoIID/LytB domain-containing protein [Bacillus altitudinis]MEE3610296.1 SpoIID/LytB domain-containing protein [Bacillus altitudinis]MEE3645915.1 SpoIID/LytB domain-containing protein [Bacillus altitudinis]MEE4390338.1 SpoIID/LytB domain-containing protein [Bacillus altitudinis]MEE4394046.1 SpoIID/LytB domain-containing protein [Bacillus altitudinis]